MGTVLTGEGRPASQGTTQGTIWGEIQAPVVKLVDTSDLKSAMCLYLTMTYVNVRKLVRSHQFRIWGKSWDQSSKKA